MPARVESTALLKQLKETDERFYGKVLELRDVVEEWLGYVPATFPHYTKHSIGHSEEIILQ